MVRVRVRGWMPVKHKDRSTSMFVWEGVLVVINRC